MKKSTSIIIHCAFWALYFAVITFTFYIIENMSTSTAKPGLERLIMSALGAVIIPSIGGFYSGYLLTFTNSIKKKKTLLALNVLVFVPILQMIFFSLYLGKEYLNSLPEVFLTQYLFVLFIIIVLTTIGILIKGSLSWFEENKKKAELLQSNQSMKLELLKAQTDPHFLFNTINNIDVLILKNPEKASEYINKLADILRFMLYETNHDFIPLKQEINYLEKYISLQQIRPNNPNFIDFKVEGSIDRKTISPLIFLPFIENAIKHCGNKKDDNTVSISIKVNDNNIQFNCENIINNSHKAVAQNGIGNQLIQDKLELIYPNLHELKIELIEKDNTKNDRYSVTLILQNPDV